SPTLLLPDHGLDASDVTARFADQVHLAELPAGLVHAQIELLPAQPQQLLVELLHTLFSEILQFRCFHCQFRRYIADRFTNAVLNGSLAAARSNASRASFSGTPSISYSTRPGWI